METRYLVFTGRPNAGKSSLIREVVGLKLATGKNPGTTRRISKYPLNSGLYLVDMPGFGKMMGVSRRLEDRMNDRIISFLEFNAQKIVLVVHVLDISTFLEVTERLSKKGFISVDVEMIKILTKVLAELPVVAANKIDKLNRDKLELNLEEFIYQISDGNPSRVEDSVFPVSAKTGEGLGALKSNIHERLVAKGYKTPFRIA